ncbi:MAG: peptidylprolyl isomerase [Ignavibacteria bacterium]|nr:peptidylprolyl isomerase [Ignavibacteria bacterium]
MIKIFKSQWNLRLGIFDFRRFHWESLFLIYLILFPSCSEENLPEDYLAVVNDRMLTKRTVNFLVDSLYLNEASIEQIIQSWIEMELLTQAALSEGFEAKDEYAVRSDLNSRRLLATQYLKEKLKEVNLTVSKEEIEDYFFKHKNEFVLNYDVYKVNQVIVKNLSKAIDLRNTTLAQLDFSKSIKVTFRPEEIVGERYGIYLKEFDEMPYELANVIQTLLPGEITYPIDLGNGEYLVTQLISKYNKGDEPAIEFVKELIEERIIFERQRKYYQDLITKLAQEADIKIRELK